MNKQAEAEHQPPPYTESAGGEQGVPTYPGQPQYPAQGYGQYPPPIYTQGNQPMVYGNVQVIQTQPMLGMAGQPNSPPPDHMCAAIFVTLCCFWPTGIIAIMKASDARSATARGDLVGAHLSAKSSKQMINISIIVGIIALIILGIIIGLYVGLFLTRIYY